MSTGDERVPPHDLDSEMAVLGSMMMNAGVIDEVMPLLGAGYFYLPAHGEIFTAICTMHLDGRPVDLLLFEDELRRTDSLESGGGRDYLIQLSESFGDWVNGPHYARLVREAFRKRELIRVGMELAEEGYRRITESDKMVASAGRKLDRIIEGGSGDRVVDVVELIKELPKAYEDGAPKMFVGTGFVGFDEVIGGLERGALIILAALPKAGKTSLALAMAISASSGGDRVPALMFSLEMPGRQIAARLAVLVSGPSMRVLQRDMTPRERCNVADCTAMHIGDGMLFVADEVEDPRDVCALSRAMVRKHNVGLIVVDYLQLLRGRRGETRNLEVAEMTRSFKRLAIETNTAVLVLSQLNREAAKAGPGGKRGVPKSSQLRDSGAIEQDADMVLILSRDETAEQLIRDGATTVEVTLRVDRNRSGVTRDFEFNFHPQRMAFSMGVGDGDLPF